MLQKTNFNKKSSLFSLFKQALNGQEQDYTTGSIRKAVIMLAIPMILEMGMESIFAVVDLFFVSRLPDSKHAISTVGLTESVLTLVYSLAIGMSMAATALVARRIGEKNTDEAAHAGFQAIIVSIVITIIISITGWIFAGNILQLMGAEKETITTGTVYTRIMMGGSIVIMLLFLINGIFRGAGNAAIAMKSLWIANICNIILCPVLIYGAGPIPGLGLVGAALATTIGRGIGVCYQVYNLFKGNGVIHIKLHHLKPDLSIIRSVINIAWPATFQFIIASCSWIFLARLVAETGGSDASAGYQTAIRIVVFFILPAWGMSNAAATLVGQNLGAKQPERAEQSVLKTAKYNGIFMFLVSVLFLAGAEIIISVFNKNTEIVNYAVQALRIISTGYVFYGIGMVVTNAFNGAGDTRTPTWINLLGFWIFQIPLAYALAKYFQLGPTGVFVSVPIAETAITIAGIIVFKKGKWKLVKV